MTTSGRTPRAVLLLSAAVFVALTAAVIVLGDLPLDTRARAAILHAATPDVVAAMRVVNLGGNWRTLLPGTLLFFVLFPRTRARWWIWIALMIVAPVSEGLLKVIASRHRPEDLSFGFPSGHATAAAAFFAAVMYLAATLPAPARRAVRVLAPVCIVLVALARVVLRAHWPSDALAGIALGLGLASVAMLIDQTLGGLGSPEPPGRPMPDAMPRGTPPRERKISSVTPPPS